MNYNYRPDNLLKLPREKRYKVSKACLGCRVKKIKCDGLHPCMQCKARNRHCSFSSENAATYSTVSTCTEAQLEEEKYRKKASRPNISAFSLSKEQELLKKTSSLLDRLSTLSPGEGKRGRWLVDINLIFQGDASNCICRVPSHETINANLIDTFFHNLYTVFPILPKSIFYRLLEHQDAFITPCLLYSIYCNAAHNENMNKANEYYRHARLLLERDLDSPSLSTVVSLCLLSIFESNRSSAGPHAGPNHSRIFSDMACRMCYDFKLHKRYSNHQTVATLDEIELRKRTYWICYCLDKMNSLVTGKPFLLSSKDVDIDLPMVLGTNDPNECQINMCFLEHIQLMQISEEALNMKLPDRQAGAVRPAENEQFVLSLDRQLLSWLRRLPPSLQWTTLSTQTTLRSHAYSVHLHLIYNYISIYVLQPITSTSLSLSPNSLLIQQRCSTVATHTTQFTCAILNQPTLIFSFTLVAEAIMAATRIHLVDCADEREDIARHSRYMFQQSLRCLRSVLQQRVIPSIHEFTTMIEKALIDADTGDSNSRNSSPKVHVLSPIIPRTITTLPKQEIMDDSWSHGRLPSNNVFSYGLISPTSSTASSTNDKHDSLYSPLSFHHSIPISSSETKQDQMEMYSGIWSSRSIYDLEHSFPLAKTVHHPFKEENKKDKEKDTKPKKTDIYVPQTNATSRYGLGIYASAQQHHTEVIRRHIPEMM